MKYQTINEVTEALGLINWNQYKSKNIGRGKTTLMLVTAIYYSQQFTVYIIGSGLIRSKQLINKAHMMCQKLELEIENIKEFPNLEIEVLEDINFSHSHIYMDDYDFYMDEYDFNNYYYESLLDQIEYISNVSKPANWL